MKLEYSLNIRSDSIWKIVSPSNQAKRLPFYLIEWGHFIAQKDYYTKRSGADLYLAFATLSGKGMLRYKDNEYQLTKGTIAVISCKEKHIYRTQGDEWNFKWVHFNGIAAKEYIHLLNDQALTIFNINTAEYLDIIDELGNYVDCHDIIHLLTVSDLFTKLFTKLIAEKIKGTDQLKHFEIKFDRVIEYMTKNYEKKISLSELSQIAYISQYHMLRSFKRIYGITPREYLLNIRLKAVKEYLAMTDLPIAQIAEKCGFCDSKNLILNFKKNAHMTPGKYRKLTGVQTEK